MGKHLTINWGYNRGGQHAFRLEINGEAYEKAIAPETRERMKLESDLLATTRRFGSYDHITATNEFRSSPHTRPGDHARLIAAFQREGWNVRNVGAYQNGQLLPAAEPIMFERPTKRLSLAQQGRKAGTSQPPKSRGAPQEVAYSL